MGGKKFSVEDLYQFIDMYYNVKYLWDVKCKEYGHLNARNNAYSTIADIWDSSVS